MKEAIQSPSRLRCFVSIATRKTILLRIVRNFRIRRREKAILMVMLLFLVLKILILEIVW
jgi:hypothetical protein